jgi:hypothetical protein
VWLLWLWVVGKGSKWSDGAMDVAKGNKYQRISPTWGFSFFRDHTKTDEWFCG